MRTETKQRISLLLCLALVACITQAEGSKITTSDPYCQKFNSKGKCIQCCDRYFYDSETCLCTKVSDTCETYDSATGECLTCYAGYGLPINGFCSSTPVQQCDHQDFDFNCKCHNDDKVCVSCYKGYHLNQDNLCIEGDSQEDCDHCVEYKYMDKKGKFYQSWRTDCSPICTECEDGYYLDCENKCQALPQNCEEVDEKGVCTECEEGYEFDEDGVCVLTFVDEIDHCCEYWWVSAKGKWYSNWRSGCEKVCKKCEDGYYLNSDNECVEYPPHCTDVNEDEDCTCCAAGYKLDSHNDCVSIVVVQPDDHCSKYCYMNDKGSKFSKWTLGCKKVCKLCDEGFYLDCDYNCVELPENCAEADKDGDCTKCEANYQLDTQGNCVPIPEGPADDHCAEYQYGDDKGAWHKKWFKGCHRVCKTCDAEYSLDNNGKCILGSDPLCVTTNIDGTCDVCAFRSVRGKLGRCIAVDGQCKDWDNKTGLCTNCYGGYKLVKGACVVA